MISAFQPRLCEKARAHRYFADCLRRFYATAKRHDPLRILFCGSDEFSIASLKALHAEYIRSEDRIATIDVVCRPGKPAGRGLKKIREVPIADAARQLQIPLHQIDTFRGWQAPEPKGSPINLIVAVSFGLLVPPRILSVAKYGGLNVHPSMLPDLSGPAPLHHTLLQRRERTGLTVQTLHPKHFDRGAVLCQTPWPGFEHHCGSVPDLLKLMAREGARMLMTCIKDSGFVPPVKAVALSHTGQPERDFLGAPKISSKDRHIDWTNWKADDILLRHKVIGPLWNVSTSEDDDTSVNKRIVWSAGFTQVDHVPFPSLQMGEPFITSLELSGAAAYLQTCDHKILRVPELTIEGLHRDDPVKSSKRAGIFSGAAVNQSSEDASFPQVYKLWRGRVV